MKRYRVVVECELVFVRTYVVVAMDEGAAKAIERDEQADLLTGAWTNCYRKASVKP
jgi:hypothetical protein